MAKCRKKLISADEAKPRKNQHKTPCSDCPWRRDSLRGWLGGATAQEWIEIACSDSFVECHTCGNQQCAGLAIFRTNICKSPRNPSVLTLPKDVKTVFANLKEFLNHHE